MQANVIGEDLTYSITDAIPEGMTYVEGSASEGATVTDGVLTWESVLPTAAGLEGEYAITRSGADPFCAHPLSEDGSYVDLEEPGFTTASQISGDTVAFGVGDLAPFSFYGVDYDEIWLTDDGFAVFDAETNYAGEPWVPRRSPTPTRRTTSWPMLWQDMEIVYDEATRRRGDEQGGDHRERRRHRRGPRGGHLARRPPADRGPGDHLRRPAHRLPRPGGRRGRVRVLRRL